MRWDCGVFVVPDIGEIGVFKGDNYKVARLEPYGLAFADGGKTVVLYDTVALYESLMDFLSRELRGCKSFTLEIDADEIKLSSVSELSNALDYVTMLYILALRARPSYIYVVGGKGRGPRQSMSKIMARASPIPPRYVAHRPPPFPLPGSVEGVSIAAHRISGERYRALVRVRGSVDMAKARVVETEDLYRRIIGGLVSSLPQLNWIEYVFL